MPFTFSPISVARAQSRIPDVSLSRSQRAAAAGGVPVAHHEFVTGALFYDTGAAVPGSVTLDDSSATTASACAPAAAQS